MTTWTIPALQPWETMPGAVDPPAPAEVQPTDPGWSDFVRAEAKAAGIIWTPRCRVGIEVTATGHSELRVIDGSECEGYSESLKWGWRVDGNYETTPPEPYQDFTRWVRNYKAVRWQRCEQYSVQVIIECDDDFVTRRPRTFWKPVGDPVSGPADIYEWTRTSGIEVDASGSGYKWRASVLKPPVWALPEPPGRPDISRPLTTPPPYWVQEFLRPPEKPFSASEFLRPFGVERPAERVPAPTRELKWARMGDLPDGKQRVR